ncbi:MAG: hypothetical protein U0X40_04450 [Ferruginibacter sp.]
MLTETQTQQLLDEAQTWLNNLVTYVAGMNDAKAKLYKWAAGKTERDTRIQIEHFHNQFHIQLINLHDLKHSIRHYMQEIKHLPDADYNEKHEQILEQYNFLTKDLDLLNDEFKAFTGE